MTMIGPRSTPITPPMMAAVPRAWLRDSDDADIQQLQYGGGRSALHVASWTADTA